MPEFSPVEPEVLNLVADLIESYHQHLLDARVGVVYRDTGLRVGGHMRIAAALRVAHGPDDSEAVALAEAILRMSDGSMDVTL